MKLYYVNQTTIESVDVVRETKAYYFIGQSLSRFLYSKKVSKSAACLTPLEAITRAITIRESIIDNLQGQIEVEKNYLAELKRVYELNSNSNSPEPNHATEVAP